jgi:hypothetical protein
MTNQAQQLVLDFGILTVAQQERVDSFIKSSQKQVQDCITNVNTIEKLLILGGFIKGIDFENNVKAKTVTTERDFGYREDSFKADVTYEAIEGDIRILSKIYDSRENKIVTRRSYVSRSHDKLECNGITPQYRAYKPASLFAKLIENNEKAQSDYNYANREKAVINYTVNKYKELFPKATVTVGKDYNRYRNDYNEFPIVMVAFESGSWVSFRLGYENDKEITHKKFDAIEAKLSTIELLNIFNNQ